MKMGKRRMLLGVLVCAGLLGLTVWLLPRLTESAAPPGLSGNDRTLLRLWVVSAPGGGQAWLKKELRTFEKAHPGVSTWLRVVDAQELTRQDAVLPDLVLYMPGDVQNPDEYFLPLGGENVKNGLIRPELMRCGRWRDQQYGLPLCWAGWTLCIDSALEPGQVLTPAPTTLLGRPAATRDAGATPEPGYPLAAASGADCALQSPGGAALFTLGLILQERPPLPEDFASQDASAVYAAFQGRRCATAMLTTGQATAFSALVSGGGGFPFRAMAAEEVVTDQVWLGSVTSQAPREAALLLSHLTSAAAQERLSGQGLFTIREDLTLYASGLSARMEEAARQGLSAVNAFVNGQAVREAAWQFFQGQTTLSEALLPLM